MLNVFRAAQLEVYHEKIASVQSMNDRLVRTISEVSIMAHEFAVQSDATVVTSGVG